MHLRTKVTDYHVAVEDILVGMVLYTIQVLMAPIMASGLLYLPVGYANSLKQDGAPLCVKRNSKVPFCEMSKGREGFATDVGIVIGRRNSNFLGYESVPGLVL